MLTRAILILIFITIYHAAKSQSCDCKTNFDSLSTKVEESYAGYLDKTSGKDSIKYKLFKNGLALNARNTDRYGCYLLLRKYLSFFKDQHLNLLLVGVPSKSEYEDSIRSMFTSFKKVTVDTNDLRKYYEQGPLDEVEGVWNALTFDFRVAIRKVNKGLDYRYEAIVLKGDSIRWFTGQIKMNVDKVGKLYRIEYFKNDHLPDTIFGSLHDGILDLGGVYGKWQKSYPSSIRNISGSNHSEIEPPISFKKVSKEICILKIQDAWVTNKPLIDSIIGANLAIIKITPYLIVDIRGNGGGHIQTFDTIMPLIYTKPFQTDGLVVRASKDNITLYKETIENPEYASVAAELEGIVKKMKENIGKMVVVSTPNSFSYDKVMPFPRKIAVLVDKRTGSAAERFAQYAKQSDKVILVGTNTKGALDYTEIARPRDLPCPYFKFYCPMGTGNHIVFPLIDNVGISPDVRWSGDKIDTRFFMDIMGK